MYVVISAIILLVCLDRSENAVLPGCAPAMLGSEERKEIFYARLKCQLVVYRADAWSSLEVIIVAGCMPWNASMDICFPVGKN